MNTILYPDFPGLPIDLHRPNRVHDGQNLDFDLRLVHPPERNPDLEPGW